MQECLELDLNLFSNYSVHNFYQLKEGNMIFQTLTLTVIGMFFALAATENSSRSYVQDQLSALEESTLGCACKKKKRNSLKDDNLIACEGHDEPLEEETV